MKYVFCLFLCSCLMPVMANFTDPNDIPTCPSNVEGCEGVGSSRDLESCNLRAKHAYEHDVEACNDVPALGRKICLSTAQHLYLTKLRECQFNYG